MSLKDIIANADDHIIESVNVPEWGCDLFIKSMTAEERDDFELNLFKLSASNTVFKAKNAGNSDVEVDITKRMKNARAFLLSYTICDETGALVFDDGGAILGKKSSKVIDRLYNIAAKLNGIREEDIEDLTKN